MPKLLSQNNHEGWPYIKCLVIGGLQFMEPLLRSGEHTDPVCILTMVSKYFELNHGLRVELRM
ncbi:hypothetical protein Hanom_Chr08g00684561 [Helianthus anomalus]